MQTIDQLNRKKRLNNETIEKITSLLSLEDPANKAEGIDMLAKFLVHFPDCIHQVMTETMIEALILTLKTLDNPSKAEESTQANIIYILMRTTQTVHHNSCHIMAKKGGIPIFINLLSSADKHVQANILKILNLSIHKINNALSRYENSGIVKSLIHLLNSLDAHSQADALDILVWLTDSRTKACAQILTDNQGIPALINILKTPHNNLHRKAFFILIKLIDLYKDCYKNLIDANAIPALTKLLSSDDPWVQVRAELVIKRIATHSDDHRQLINNSLARAKTHVKKTHKAIDSIFQAQAIEIEVLPQSELN